MTLARYVLVIFSCISSYAYNAFDKIEQVLKHVQTDYPYQLDDEKIAEHTILDLVSQLDRHSSYLNKKQARDLQTITSGKFIGIGAKLKLNDQHLHIISVMPGSPANKANLQVNDIITHINYNPVDPENFMQQLKGNEHEPLTLSLVRTKKNIETTLTRMAIEIPSISSKQIDDIGYIRIKLFSKHTPQELFEAITSLTPTSEAILFDLRGNPGGLLSASVIATDYLLNNKKDPIVHINEHTNEKPIAIVASEYDLSFGKPIFILVDKSTASGGEIFTKALQFYQRATVLGQRTYGKGSVQSLIPFKDGSLLKLTTAFFTGPDGSAINDKGVKPDIHFSDPSHMLAQALQFIHHNLN